MEIKLKMKCYFWIITERHKIKRLSSPQDLGAPPEIPEGEDSLTNWPNFILNSMEIKIKMKCFFWIITDRHKIKRLSSPQDLGAPPEIPEGEDSLTIWPRFILNSVEIKIKMKCYFWIITDRHKIKRLSSPQDLGALHESHGIDFEFNLSAVRVTSIQQIDIRAFDGGLSCP